MFYVQFTGTQEREQIKSRPSRRWQDDVVEKGGTSWSRTAVDRRQWRGGRGIDGGLHSAVDRQTTVEGIDGGLHPAVDRQQWRVLMEGYILQWTDSSGGY